MWSAKKDLKGWIVEHMSGQVLSAESRYMHRRLPITFKTREAAEKRAAELNAKSA